MSLVRLSDLLSIMKQKTLLIYHHKLDLAAANYETTRDLEEFARRCATVCQGTLDMKCVVREAYKFTVAVVPDNEGSKIMALRHPVPFCVN